MKCPFCGVDEDRVVDSRATGEGSSIRRRRACQSCGRRFTTYERVEETPRLVVKKDQSREPFARQKVLAGLLRACEKRPVALSDLEEVVDLVEKKINDDYEYEVDSQSIGHLVAEQLKRIDKVAFLRFASVYYEFNDVTEFLRELTPLLPDEAGRAAPPAPREPITRASSPASVSSSKNPPPKRNAEQESSPGAHTARKDS